MRVMKTMTIAVGTADMTSVSEHLARSSAFVVMEVEDGAIRSRTTRARGTGACGNHASFVEMLKGCQHVLCGGISESAENLLAAHGIESVVLAGQHSIDEAVALYLAGNLATKTERVCLCH
jgi:predicted Fe-Mo cluster-binding NifX family protein